MSPLGCPSKQFHVSGIIISRVICPLPTTPVSHNLNWEHLKCVHLVDPNFGTPRSIEVLLGVDGLHCHPAEWLAV